MMNDFSDNLGRSVPQFCKLLLVLILHLLDLILVAFDLLLDKNFVFLFHFIQLALEEPGSFGRSAFKHIFVRDLPQLDAST